ncbi:MAG: RsmB/NOP family class I SAM-dependent RNA methyltransferase [Candidatus Thorarchaeota archaeon]
MCSAINTISDDPAVLQQIIGLLSEYSTTTRTMRELLRISGSDNSEDLQTRGYVQSRVLGIIRFLNTINYIAIRALGKRNLSDFTIADQSLLRFAIYQQRWLKTPLSSTALEMLDSSGLSDTVNQAIKIDLDRRTKNMSSSNAIGIKLSHPTFIVETLLEHLGVDEAQELMKYNNGPRDYFLRVNTLLAHHEEVISLLEGQEIVLESVKELPNLFRLVSGISALFDSKEFKNGRIIVQDKGSVAVGHALAPKPGLKVWDACAAPGMKTHLLWELMKGEGHLVATDISTSRLKNMKIRCSKIGCESVEFMEADAITAPISDADKILIDAPCTSTGILRSHPSFKWRLNKESLMSLMSIQNKILDGILNAYSDKPGTEIVYATCSLLPHEGESQIDSAMTRHPIELLEMPLVGSPGYSGFDCSDKVIRLSPHRHNSNGFFIARFRITE